MKKFSFKILVLMALLIIPLLLMACDDPVQGPETGAQTTQSQNRSQTRAEMGSVMGYVLDNRGEPVEGATVTLGSKQATTNSGGEFVIDNVSSNDVNLITAQSSVITSPSTTAYTLTARKDGYISAKVTGIYVTYKELETEKSKEYITALTALYTTYSTILSKYAEAIATATSTNISTTSSTADTVTTTTTTTPPLSDEKVFETLANALADIKGKLSDTEYYTTYFSSFAGATLIPLNASFSGSIKLNLTTKGASTISETTYKPTSHPIIRASYKPDPTGNVSYNYETTIDENGHFKFDKCLPSGVAVNFTVDSFFETINDTEYCFSTESADVIIENSVYPLNTSIIQQIGQNELSCVMMLYAQNDKIWISDTNVSASTSANPLSFSDELTFTFSKEMKKVELTASGITDISEKNYTLAFSNDKKTVTVTPNDGFWTLGTSDDYTITISGEAGDGSKTILNKEFMPVFDNFVDVSLADTGTATQDSFTITFSKALKSFDALTNITIQAGTNQTTVSDYTATLDSTKKIITVTARDGVFFEKGRYKITLSNIEIVDGSNKARIDGAVGVSISPLVINANFAYDGFKLKATAIEVIDSLPETSLRSRSIIPITPDKILKITFNKPISKSEITIKVGTNSTAETPKNYIDSSNEYVVYIPLDTITKINDSIILGGEATAKTGDTAQFTQANINDWFNNTADTFKLYAALNLTGTNLINEIDHVTGEPEYVKADPISAGTAITFDFDAVLTDYTATYKLFGLEDVDKDTTPADIKLLVENGTATISGNSVTISDNHLKAKRKAGAKATYYLELIIKNADGAKLFSTTNPYFGTTDGSFEKTARQVGIYDAPSVYTPDTTPNANKNYGSFIIEVAEKDHLVSTNLIKVENTPLSDAVYTPESTFAPKSAITFTFDTSLTGCTAKYELFDLASSSNNNNPQVIASGNATISGSTVTFQNDLMVSGNPVVAGKTFNVNTDRITGISTYYLKIEVKDSSGTVIFSSDNDWWNAPTSFALDKRTDFQKELEVIVRNGKFKIPIAPLSITNLSFVEEVTDSFGVGTEEYEALEIDPKKSITFTFNADIPAQSKYSYQIKNSTEVIDESAEGGITISAATRSITIQSDEMLASPDLVQNYTVTLKIKDSDDVVLFDTANNYFGYSSEYEQAVSINTIDAIDTTNNVFNVKIVQTKIITQGIDGVESRTTKDREFKESFKSPIVLQFSHPIRNYRAVLYSTNQLYTNANPSMTHQLSTFNSNLEYDDFMNESAEYIYPSECSISGKTMTITPTYFFMPGATVNIAIFGADNKYLNVKDDSLTPAAVTYTTSENGINDHNAEIKLVKEMLSGARPLTVATETTQIGNSKPIALSIPTEYSPTSDSLATYTLFLKKAEGYEYEYIDNFGVKDRITNGLDITKLNYRLGRAGTSYIIHTLPSDACDYYGSTPKYASYVLLKNLDGVITAFKTSDNAISDSVGPELFAPETASTDSNETNISFTSITNTGVKYNSSTSTFELVGTEVPLSTGTDPAQEYNNGFTMTLSCNEAVKSATVSYTGHTNENASSSQNSSTITTATVSYSPDSKTVTVLFKATDGKAYVYHDDSIAISLTDASGNEKRYSIIIKHD